MRAEIDRTYRHKKRGTTYRVQQFTTCQNRLEEGTALAFLAGEADAGMIVGMAEVQGTIEARDEIVIYAGLDNGKAWARGRTEFEDGRFEELVQ